MLRRRRSVVVLPARWRRSWSSTPRVGEETALFWLAVSGLGDANLRKSFLPRLGVLLVCLFGV